MYKKKPLFITFEGIEGCGKTYQSLRLYKKLKKRKIPTILTREPGGTISAENKKDKTGVCQGARFIISLPAV